jgi:hypothetical protein
LSASLRYIIESGEFDLKFHIAQNQPWDETAIGRLEVELERLTDFLVSYYKGSGIFPVEYFRPGENPAKSNKNKTGYICAAGRGRMAITPEENIWGCVQFHDYLKGKEESDDFRTYSFGKLDEFAKNHETLYPRVLANHSILRQDFYFTKKQSCFLCRDLGDCMFCPVYSAYSTSVIGKIPPWGCIINRIVVKAKKKFLTEIDRINARF